MQVRFVVIAVIVSILVVSSAILAIYFIRPNNALVTGSSQTTGSQSSSNFSIGEVLRIPANGALAVHVRYYYYNFTSPMSFNFSKGNQIIVQGSSGGSTFSAFSEFTIQSDVGSVLMGGPGNQSEGIMVNYLIFLSSHSSGTYTLNFGWLFPGLYACAVDYQLSIGNGNPNYGWTGGCTSPLSERYPVNSNGLVNGFLFAEIVGVSNATLPSKG